MIQLRIKSKDFSQTQICAIAKEINGLKKKYPFTFIVNDFVDVALEVKADGVHVGAEDLPIAEVRRKIGKKMSIGYSSHSLEEALEAQAAGADYVAFGAIFPSITKGPGHPVQGVKKLREVVERVKIPVVAIGGIGRENFEQVLQTGVKAIAMITALTQANDISEEVKYYETCFSHRRV